MKEEIYIHESSYVDDDVSIGEGTKVWHFSHIQSGASIGKNCIIGQNVNIGPNVTMGNNVKIQNNVSVYKGVVIEDDVFVGPSVVFTNVKNPRSFVERKDEFKTILLKKGCSVGANATVLCGVEIGRYAMIGAGSVVTKDVKEHIVTVGCPAERIGKICKCGEIIKKNNENMIEPFECSLCGTKIY